jgi:hypothetical protein
VLFFGPSRQMPGSTLSCGTTALLHIPYMPLSNNRPVIGRYKMREMSHKYIHIYRGADKSLARPGKKQATATEDFDVYISYLLS